MPLKFSTPLRTARMQAVLTLLDTGAGNATFKFYTAPQPAAGNAITTQTLLGTCTASKPSGTVNNGVLTFAAIADDVSVDADGDIAWVRVLNGNGDFVMDGDCGIANTTFIVNTITARIGGLLKILSGVLTEGNA